MHLDENANIVLTTHSVSARNDSLLRLLLTRSSTNRTRNRKLHDTVTSNERQQHSNSDVTQYRSFVATQKAARKKEGKGKAKKLVKSRKDSQTQTTVCVFDPIFEGEFYHKYSQHHYKCFYSFNCVCFGRKK